MAQALPTTQRYTKLHYLLDSIPEARDAILSHLLPMDSARLMCITQRTLSEKEKLHHLDPLSHLVRDREHLKSMFRLGMRVVFLGKDMKALIDRIRNPQLYISESELPLMAFRMLIFRPGYQVAQPMYRFLMDRSVLQESNPEDVRNVSGYMKCIESQGTSVAGFHIEPLVIPSGMPFWRFEEGQVCTTAFFPSKASMSWYVLNMPRGLQSPLHQVTSEGECLPYTEAVQGLDGHRPVLLPTVNAPEVYSETLRLSMLVLSQWPAIGSNKIYMYRPGRSKGVLESTFVLDL